MCLYTKMTIKQCKEWVEEKRKTITAYKVVGVAESGGGKNKVYPPVFKEHGYYQRVNKIKEMPTTRSAHGQTAPLQGRSYKAGYHLMLYKKGTEAWRKWLDGSESGLIILKCKVPRDSIVAVGTQGTEHVAIVTKEFTFAEGQQYFEDEAICA